MMSDLESLKSWRRAVPAGVADPSCRCQVQEPVMRVRVSVMVTVIGACVLVGAASMQDADSSWPTYGGTPASLKYAPLDQIDRTNAGALTIAWRWRSIDEDKKQEVGVRPWLFEATPLLIGRTL
jgi:hypothetical protein